jgi:molybdopterin-guanine dinucleotide biosynthesis protein A
MNIPVSSIILSGGRATRMHGVDKGWVLLQDKPLVQHVIDRLTPQVSEIIINANREIDQYQSLGYPVLQDERIASQMYAGPLAGMRLGLQHAQYDYLLTAPCDTPLLPMDLVQRLMAGLLHNNADIAVASSEGDAHPVICLCQQHALPSLDRYLANGGRKVSTWQKTLTYVEVDFSDYSSAFVNLNTMEALAALEMKLCHA